MGKSHLGVEELKTEPLFTKIHVRKQLDGQSKMKCSFLGQSHK